MRIVVDGVEVWYNSTQALRDVSLEIESGECVFVIGPNGSGKTTLLKTIASIVKPRRGAVYIDGKALSEYSSRELSRILTLVDPHISRSIPSTVLEFLLTARYPHQKLFETKIGGRDLEIIDKIAGELSIRDLLTRRLDQLSSGEFQRVIIARALVQEPRVLLLDEPSAFLDIRYKIETLELIKRVTIDRGIVSLVASHDIYLASLYADRVIVLSRGVVEAFGSPEEVLKRDLLEKIYRIKILETYVDRRKILLPYRGTVDS
ncbi:MAG: ABC transporter ATP-binding protein [Sulfolobales archaeon]